MYLMRCNHLDSSAHTLGTALRMPTMTKKTTTRNKMPAHKPVKDVSRFSSLVSRQRRMVRPCMRPGQKYCNKRDKLLSMLSWKRDTLKFKIQRIESPIELMQPNEDETQDDDGSRCESSTGVVNGRNSRRGGDDRR